MALLIAWALTCKGTAYKKIPYSVDFNKRMIHRVAVSAQGLTVPVIAHKKRPGATSQ